MDNLDTLNTLQYTQIVTTLMKSLLALLLLGIALGIGFWKTENPEASFADLPSSAASGLNKFKGSIASLTSGSGALSTGGANASLPEAVTDQLGAASGRLDSSEAKVAAIESQLDLLNRRIDAQSEKFNVDSINSSLEDLKRSIPQIQEEQARQFSEQGALIADLNERIDLFDSRLNTLSTDGIAEGSSPGMNVQMDQRMAMLEGKLVNTDSQSMRIESLTNELNISREKISTLEEAMTSSQRKMNQLDRNISSLRTKSESSSIDDQQSELKMQLSELQKQMSRGDGSDVSELANALQQSRERIQMLEQRVVDLPASSNEATDATQAQSALQSQISVLEQKLAQFEASSDPSLASTISQVERQVSALAAKSYVTQEELRSQKLGKSIEYKIYFERNSTAITAEAGKVLNSFIAQEKNRTTGVSIFGFTDRRGSALYNQQLALQRATNVRSYLIQNGFSYTKIRSISGLGEDAAAVDLADGAEDAQQRTVVLYAQQP